MKTGKTDDVMNTRVGGRCCISDIIFSLFSFFFPSTMSLGNAALMRTYARS